MKETDKRKIRVGDIVGIREPGISNLVVRIANFFALPLISCFILIRSGIPYWLKKVIKERSLCKIEAKKIDKHYERDTRFLCTELVIKSYADLGIDIVPKGVVPIPSSLQEAELNEAELAELNEKFKGRLAPVFLNLIRRNKEAILEKLRLALLQISIVKLSQLGVTLA
jgi:hypothetical protein